MLVDNRLSEFLDEFTVRIPLIIASVEISVVPKPESAIVSEFEVISLPIMIRPDESMVNAVVASAPVPPVFRSILPVRVNRIPELSSPVLNLVSVPAEFT